MRGIEPGDGSGRGPAADCPARAPGWWYPWIIVCGLAIVVVVNAGLLFMAVTTFPGLLAERDDGAQALCYARFAAVRESRDLGWQAVLRFTPTGPHRGRITARLIDKGEDALEGLKVTARVVRPTHTGYDRTVILSETAPGEYAADVTLPLAGLWDVQLSAEWGFNKFWRIWRIDAS